MELLEKSFQYWINVTMGPLQYIYIYIWYNMFNRTYIQCKSKLLLKYVNKRINLIIMLTHYFDLFVEKNKLIELN